MARRGSGTVLERNAVANAVRSSDAPADVWIDDGGLLRRGARWVALPDIDWRLMELLLERREQLVRRDELAAVAWPDRQLEPSALNVRIKLLRERIRDLGLSLATVRGRGYVLQVAPDAG